MTSINSTILVGTALASIMGCYAISLRAASERSAIVAAHERIARDVADMRLLRAELRTRSRLPELQRWNEQVLALAPPRAEQLVANPVLLASYALPAAPAAAKPAAPLATVVRDAPPAPAVLRRAGYTPRAAPDLGTAAARIGGAAALQVSFQKVALR